MKARKNEGFKEEKLDIMGSNTLGVALINDLNNEGLRNMEIEGFTMELDG